MKKILFTALIASAFSAGCVFGQTYWSKHYDFNIGNEFASNVIPVEDGIIFQNFGLCDLNSRKCSGMTKIDFDGNQIWESIVYDTLIINAYNGFVIRDDTALLNMTYIGNTSKAFSVLSFDFDGNYISRFDYAKENPSVTKNILLRPDGCVYVTFDIQDPITSQFVQYTRCYDRNWNLLWTVHTPSNVGLNRVNSIVSLDSGLVIGYTAWPGGGQQLAFNIEKYNKNGEFQWHTNYQYGCDNTEQVIKINAMPDGSYIGAFVSDSFGFQIASDLELWFKLDANGNKIWEKANIMEERSIFQSFVNHNGNIIACGAMNEFYFDTIQDPPISAYYMCLNPDGERIWERKLLDKTAGITSQYLLGGAELPNGDLVFVGQVWDTIHTPENPTFADSWVIKTDNQGCFSPGCGEWQELLATTELKQPSPMPHTFGIYPNPVTDYCNLVATLGEIIPSGQYLARSYDSNGRLLFSKTIDPKLLNQLDFSEAPEGICTVALFRNGAAYQTFKVVKISKKI